MTERSDPAEFSAIDSLAKTQARFADGALEKLYLLPLEFGGKDVEENAVYVPRGIADAKRQIDGMVGEILRDGSVSKYSAEPQYVGGSFVPRRIVIKAWHPQKSGVVSHAIEIW